MAFLNCKKLTNFDIPKNVSSIGRMALTGCESIKEINIPKNVDCIEVGALAQMSSLEKITVDKDSEKYFTEDDDTVLISKDGIIIQYAINCNRDEFIVGYHIESFGNTINELGEAIPLESNALIYNIADYAFAGAKKLKKIYINSELESIGGKTFLDCDNLKDLEVYHTDYGDSFLMHIFKSLNEEAEIPFENIIIGEEIQTLCGISSDLFKNARNITLPNSLEDINEEVFTKSKDLTNLIIPNNIKSIIPNTFYPEIEITFPAFGTIKGKDFNMLQTKTSEDYYMNYHNKGNIRIFALNDGTYYVKINDYDTVKINRDEIMKLSNSSHIMANNPDDFIMYLCDLLVINTERKKILTNIWTDPKLEETFNKFVNDCNYVQEIATNKTARAIREIIDNSGMYDEFLFTGVIMRNIRKKELIKILSNYNNSISRFFRLSKLDEDKDVIINADKLIKYCNLLEKYQRYDKFFYNSIFFEKVSDKNQELLIRFFNKNIKHLLINSQTLHDKYGENLNDLLNLCNSLGVFSDEARISQKMSTFINERMVNKNSTNPIIGNDIHTIFCGINPRDEIDYEFIIFFVDNYEKLIELKKTHLELL